ncbi:MAG TPA: AmmeMemoRadiSam system protein B [Elusimicrobiota bacterium]|nr:AmmeMemoRadiSam system protein B [Elusimicrobiota bacterium]
MAIWSPSSPLPPLRARLEAVPVEDEGKPLFLLRDLEEIAPSTLAMSAGGMLAASLFDGKRTAADISGLFGKATGQFLKPEEILSLADELDRALLLETEPVAKKRGEIVERFRQSLSRKAAFAGVSYPAEPLELGGLLGGFFKHPQGPGQEPAAQALKPPPLLVVSPHIDFHRGGPSYAWAYQALSQCRPPDLIVALGVAHMSPNSPWAATRKAYETPYGPVAADEGLYEDLRGSLWYDPAEDETVHRGEHSLEFQAVWLKHLWRDKTPPWLPVLCSSFERFSPDEPPSKVATVEKALVDWGEKIKARHAAGQSVMILAGVDLAHVGPRFGDDVEVDEALAKRVEEGDRASIARALELDADGFYRSAAGEAAWRKVCGLSALYTELRLAKIIGGQGAAAPGRLLSYGQAPDPAGGIVSFCSAVFPG